ncbi:hypothetical protein PAXINDRAFT_118184 [Paxillus involutus ATCC 200175]|uniref:BTB domain-containing protein n=1 Tax=Paxillus involutus ATCC 200175 TaxID=664439 RepID=A0A0C9STT7_PAXIN|nr:hypothetical protein PAXINDRAFT_118184 [Paxillus involutus ATCC 200175]
MEEYGYESDSDLGDEEPPPIVVDAKDQADTMETSDTFVSDPGDDAGSDGALLVKSDASTDATVQNSPLPSGASVRAAGNSVRLLSLGSRHILIKDTAFQTWYTLLNYLYTGKVTFLPPKSSAVQSERSPEGPEEKPKCSAKSMYRLACKVGLDDLRDEAFASIKGHLTENNILRELSCKLLSRYPALLEMELDVLYDHIASPPVVAGFPELAKRIASKELPQGADIIIGLHTRTVREHYPPAWTPPQPVVLNKPQTKTAFPPGRQAARTNGATERSRAILPAGTLVFAPKGNLTSPPRDTKPNMHGGDKECEWEVAEKSMPMPKQNPLFSLNNVFLGQKDR